METAPDVKTYGFRAADEERGIIGFDGFKVDPRVIFVDPNGRPHHALITTVHSMLEDGSAPWAVNLVYVTDDCTKTDPYGLQLERATSVSHESKSGAHGFFFRTV